MEKNKKPFQYFMRQWEALGKKEQKNLPLPHDLREIVEELGGSGFVIMSVLKELNRRGKLPAAYKRFLSMFGD